MKKKTINKLVVKKQTVTNLTEQMARRLAGGIDTSCGACPATECNCLTCENSCAPRSCNVFE
jgi:hypothetical protein